MFVNFEVKGRLGNAIYRYLACSVMCIKYGYSYTINNKQRKNFSDIEFYNLLTNNLSHINEVSMNMSEYYQHDTIYKNYKNEIINYIKQHPEHFVLTDGINAGDGNREKFKMIDIINTPNNFNKKYNIVLHLRLEDFVIHNLYIKTERITKLLENIYKSYKDDNKRIHELCIVCKKPTTDFEINYINTIKECIYKENQNTLIITEHNDTLTDYYIMKNAETLICSKSTLSWCGAFFSENIKTCYLPDYVIQPGIMTCKSPIDNTILY